MVNLSKVWVVIVAGGQGTRLFPISHTNCPKQFCQLDGKRTFIQATIENFVKLGIKQNKIVIVTTSENQTRLAREQTLSRGILSQNIYEIDPKYGYAGAMVKASMFIRNIEKDAIIINTPSDQYIVSNEEFETSINIAVTAAMSYKPVIIGVKINDLNTAIGCGHAIYAESADAYGCHAVEKFIEKPNVSIANRIMRDGNSACNTGIAVWHANTIYSAAGIGSIVGLATDELMRRLPDLRIAVGSFEWHDCGTLKSLYDISKKTPNHKNASLGAGSFERNDCRRCLLYAAEGMELRVTGGEDDAVIFTSINEKPIIVVAKMSESQRIKELAESFKIHESLLTSDFQIAAKNNIILRSNVKNLTVGFVGVENYAVYAHEEKDGTMTAAVSLQFTK